MTKVVYDLLGRGSIDPLNRSLKFRTGFLIEQQHIEQHRPIQLSSKSNQSIYLEHPMGRKQGDCDGPYQTGAETRFYCLAMNISQDEVAEHWTSVRDRIQKDISRINTLRNLIYCILMSCILPGSSIVPLSY